MGLLDRILRGRGAAARTPRGDPVAAALGALDAGDLGAAEALCREALRRDESDAIAHLVLGGVLGRLGRLEEALERLERAGALDPALAEAHADRGNILRLAGRPEEAEAAYREALRLDPAAIAAARNLARLLWEGGRPSEASEVAAVAAGAAPDSPGDRAFLANLLTEIERYDEAIGHYEAALAGAPDDVDLRYNLGVALANAGRDEAAARLGEVLSLAPDHAQAAHMLASLTGTTTPTAPAEYVRGLFDAYSETFESWLVERLEYRMPAALRGAVDALRDPVRPFARGLDLGCGTGLCGEAFRDACRHLVGIDLSPRMLEKARAKGVYDELVEGDLVAAVRSQPPSDLFVAGDVFIYVGELSAVFAAVAGRAERGALFAFTAERADEDEGPFVLRPTGRYAHSERGLRDYASSAGLAVHTCERVSLRKHHDDWVDGLLVVVRAGR